MPTRIHLGLSTCPNDTYLAHALLTGAVETPGLELDIELMDVQELNERLSRGDFDVAKASYHLALRHADELLVMPTGSALGFGNGPLLLARGELTGTLPSPVSRVLCPGEDTTATLLYRLFHAGGAPPEQRVFSEIMPALGPARRASACASTRAASPTRRADSSASRTSAPLGRRRAPLRSEASSRDGPSTRP